MVGNRLRRIKRSKGGRLAVTILSIWRVVWEWWARAGECSCSCFVGLVERGGRVVGKRERRWAKKSTRLSAGPSKTIGLHDNNDAMGVDT